MEPQEEPGSLWQYFRIAAKAEEVLRTCTAEDRIEIELLLSRWHESFKARAAAPFAGEDERIDVPIRCDGGRLYRAWLRLRQARTNHRGRPVYRLELEDVERVGADSVARQVLRALEEGRARVHLPAGRLSLLSEAHDEPDDAGRRWREIAEELAFTVLAVLPVAIGAGCKPEWAVWLTIDDLGDSVAVRLSEVLRRLKLAEKRRIKMSMGPLDPDGRRIEDMWSSVNEGLSLYIWARTPAAHFTEPEHIAGPWLAENLGMLDDEIRWLFERSAEHWSHYTPEERLILDPERKSAFEDLIQGILVDEGLLTCGPCQGDRIGEGRWRKRYPCEDPFWPEFWLNRDKPRKHGGKPHLLTQMCPHCWGKHEPRRKTMNARKSRAARKKGK